jgi:hypothetical protein
MLIAIAGRRGSGKSATAQHLVASHGFLETSFAAPLKEAVQKWFGLSNEQVYGDYVTKEAIDRRWQVSPRQLLQVIGTDLIRHQLPQLLPDLEQSLQGESLWVRILEEQIRENLQAGKRVVVSDLRFSDEEAMIRRLGGSVWWIQRGDSNDKEPQMHASEKGPWCQGIPSYVWRIQNNKSIHDLHSNIDSVISQIRRSDV